MAAPPVYGYLPYGAPMQLQDPHVSPQFTKPTKVVHLRNLPFDVTLEEIREFCAPWGSVVALKDKVGGNRNQAFVEFAALESAVGIVTHYQRAAQPAQFRGRPTWLSFSGRDKLTNVSASVDNPTPVLQVAVNGVPPELAPIINLDLLNSLFGAYGHVKKLITYQRPEGGLYAWVQLPDAQTAATVRNQLQGQAVPRHLVNNHPSPPTLDIAFAAQPDLVIRAQSPSTRDFTNAALPWGEPDVGMIQGLLPAAGGTDGPSNVLSVSFDRMTYPVTLDGIHTIFTTYGFVQKVHIFERDGRTVALVQYADVPTADSARAALEGHAMYDGGHNVMHVVYSKHRNLSIRPGSDRSKDYTMGAVPNPPPPAAAPPPARPAAAGPPPGHYGGMPPPSGAPYGGVPPPQVATYGAPPQQQQPHFDPHFTVTGEDYVRQHERVLEQYGGRTSGKGAPAPYAAPAAYGGSYTAPAAPAYPPPAAPAYGAPPPAAYAAAPAAAYGAVPGYGAVPAAAAAYGAQPAGYGAPPAAGYGAQPAGYGAQQPAAYGAQQPAAYGAQPAATYGAQQTAAYGAQQPAAYGGYGAPQAAPAGYGGHAAPPPGNPAPPAYGAPPPGAYGGAPPQAGAFPGYGY